MKILACCVDREGSVASEDTSTSFLDVNVESLADPGGLAPATETADELEAPDLMSNIASEERTELKKRLKKALDSVERRRKEQNNKSYRSVQEAQFFILAKLFAEEEAFDELIKLSETPSAVLQILPFILNSLLYSSLAEERPEHGKANTPRKRTEDNSLSVVEKLTTERTDEYNRKFAEVIFQLCRKSVHTALHCAWYFISSLSLGPTDSYNHTMHLLLGMESAIMVNTTDHETETVFSKAQVQSVAPPTLTTKRTQVLGQAQLQILEPGQDAVEVDEKEIEAAPGQTATLKVDTYGDGVEDLQVRLDGVQASDKEHLGKWLEARKERANFFHAELDFVKCLTDLSYGLYEYPKPERKEILRHELEKLNSHLPKMAFIPVLNYPHRVLRVIPTEAFVFSTKERSPYLITFEVERLGVLPEETPSGKLAATKTATKKLLRRKTRSARDRVEVKNVPNQPEMKFTYKASLDAGEPRESETRPSGTRPSESRPSEYVEEEPEEPQNDEVDPQILEAFGEPFSEKEARIQQSSPHGHLPGWGLASCIVKARDQLRQEMFAMRLITEFYNIFRNAKLSVWIKPYQILATSWDSGFIETILDSKSLSSIRSDPSYTTLSAFFRANFGSETSQRYRRAVQNFTRSMAGYSVVCYILAIKDRHNGNIMLDSEGHICHIDFGFLLSNSPGGNREFERAPFKLTQEMIDVMGGPKSKYFKAYRKMGRRAYAEACKHVNKILLEVDMMFPGNENMPCFVGGRKVVLDGLRDRMMPNATANERMLRFDELLRLSMNNWTTRWYDRYQKCFTGVA